MILFLPLWFLDTHDQLKTGSFSSQQRRREKTLGTRVSSEQASCDEWFKLMGKGPHPINAYLYNLIYLIKYAVGSSEL